MKIKTMLCALTIGGALVGGAADNLNLWPVFHYASSTNGWAFNTCLGVAGAELNADGSHCSWTFPLWYEDGDSFYSLLWTQGKKGTEGAESWWTIPPLLSWGDTRRTEKLYRTEGSILLGLGGWYAWSEASNDYRTWWAFPILWRDSDGSWMTLLGGRFACGGTTNDVYTPLVGITRGTHTGGWFFPFWSKYASPDFGDKAALIGSPTLPDGISVSTVTSGRGERATKRLHGEAFTSSDEMTVLLSDISHRVLGHDVLSSEEAYILCDVYARGTRLLSSYRSLRTEKYDLKTRAKLSDRMKVEGGILEWLGLYWYDYSQNMMTGGESTRHRVLWKVWDWFENAQGELSLDVFPGFNYSSRPDGYSKTSFWWRLFRYESDPKGGTSVDFLFIPIWR